MRWLKFTNNSVSHRWSFLCLSINRVRFERAKVREGRVKIRVRTVKVRVRRVKVTVSAGKVKAVVPKSQSKHETIRPIE